MTNETEQLRRLVDARERATKGDWELQITKFPDGIKSLEIITPNYDVVSAVVRHPIRALEDAHFIALSGTLDLRAQNNMALSQARAQGMVDYFKQRQIAPERLSPVGYGEDRPVADNETAAGRAKNRRVEFHLSVRSNSETAHP
jgi:hypothetical protein